MFLLHLNLLSTCHVPSHLLFLTSEFGSGDVEFLGDDPKFWPANHKTHICEFTTIIKIMYTRDFDTKAKHVVHLMVLLEVSTCIRMHLRSYLLTAIQFSFIAVCHLYKTSFIITCFYFIVPPAPQTLSVTSQSIINGMVPVYVEWEVCSVL